MRVAVCLLAVLMPFAAIAQRVVYVDKHGAAGGGGSGMTCANVGTSGNRGESLLNPLKQGDSLRPDPLRFVLNCTTTGQDVWDIRVVCTNPTNPDGGQSERFCDYDDATSGAYDFGHVGSTATGHQLRGEPYNQVRIKSFGIQVKGKSWTISGFTFDGKRDSLTAADEFGTGAWTGLGPDGGLKSTGTFIELEENDILFHHNVVENSNRSCVLVGDSSDVGPTKSDPSGVRVTHNVIRRCYGFHQFHEDHHAVYTNNADNLQVLFNDGYKVQGDFYQSVTNLPDSGTGVHEYEKSPGNTKVIGNRMWTGPVYDLEGGLCIHPGENGVDVKRLALGFLFKDNMAAGYRPPTIVNGVCTGTTEWVSRGERGGALVFQGRIEDDNGTKVNGLYPECTAAQSLAGECGVVEGNDVFDTQEGIAVSGTEWTGASRGYLIRGNYVHDLTVGIPDSGEPDGQGRALNLHNRIAVDPSVPNYVVRNTLVNLPGQAVDLAAPAAANPPPQGSTQSQGFILGNNIIAWTASAFRYGGTGNAQCQGITSVLDGGTPFSYGDWRYEAVAPYQGSSPVNGIAYVQGTSPLFQLPWATHPRNGPHPGGSPPNDYFRSCGEPLAAYTAASFLTQHDTAQPSYDYRLLASTTATGADVSQAVLAKRHSDMADTCGTTTEFGAHETCATDLIWLRETGSNVSSRDQEYFDTTQGAFWVSPDLGIMSAASIDAGSPLAETTGELKTGAVFWNTPAKVLVRVRFTNATELAGEDLKFRVFLGRPHTTFNFPSDYERIVPAITDTAEYVVIPWNSTTGTGWELLSSTTTERIYAFPYTPRAFKGDDLHSCLRGEISTPKDPRPPFFTAVARSNNLAQRNMSILGGVAKKMSIDFEYGGLRPDEATTNAVRITVDAALAANRPTYLYIPNKGEAGRYRDDDTQPWPPTDGTLYAIEVNNGPFTRNLTLQTQKRTFMQVLMDLGLHGAPTATEKVKVDDGSGGITRQLAPDLYFESFEFGNGGWTQQPATGPWRVSNEPRDGSSCGSAAGGRFGLATNFLARGCTYEGDWPGTATFTSPWLPLATLRYGQVLRFRHWAQIEASKTENLEVLLVISDATGTVTRPLKAWNGSRTPQIGKPDEFVFEAVNVREYLTDAYRNRKNVSIQFKFTADSIFNNYRGWFVDDVGIE